MKPCTHMEPGPKVWPWLPCGKPGRPYYFGTRDGTMVTGIQWVCEQHARKALIYGQELSEDDLAVAEVMFG